MAAAVAAKVSNGQAGATDPAVEEGAMKGVEATPEEQERLATGNNNGSLVCKLPEPEEPDSCAAFHSTRIFMLVFLSGWVLQGMFLTYFVSVTTTIEKLFKVESKTTGTLLAATEIGQICTALFLTYLAGRGHRPRWIACMMLVLAVGVIGCMMPHMAYGTELLEVHLDSHTAGAGPVCALDKNSSLIKCDDAQVQSTKTRSSITAVVIPWLFICLLVVGVGQTGIATLGIPYVDDNVGSRQSPLYMAITIGIRVIGPALGFMLGALCTRVYVDPLADPGYDNTDPRWVGAWWLGMVVIAGFVVILSILMFFFPRQIKQSPQPLPRKKSKEKSEPFFKDFFATIKRQLTNDILMWRTASSVLHLMPISGLVSFLPKYLEKQFRLPTHDANLVSGLGGILIMGLGIITSGVVILKLVPTARQVAAWTAASAAMYSAGMVVLMFVSCPEESFRMLSESGVTSNLSCSANCHCDGAPYSPVCGQDSFTYVSACQAGCAASHQLDNSTWLYYNCSCIEDHDRGQKAMAIIERYAIWNTSEVLGVGGGGGGLAVSGECGGPCAQLYVFVAIFAAAMFIHATGEVGAVLLIIRCTDKHDKAMAMGVIQFAIGVFGNVPCPILFGAAVDAACRLRDAACGLLGACASYDNDSLRHLYLGLAAGLMFLAFIMDMLVWSKAGRIDMNPAETPDAAPLARPLAPHEPHAPHEPLAPYAPHAPPDTQL
ncbi:PREDICTED: solute carrier organic anion transporter family member 2A1-like isoform X1 [Papilio xuthus]|uniref:Solute carrier organic anion transporter family member n=3 Tax=Papilio xuthus TaxID=66420 RepID=A0AAJ6ZP98_PAPXU|nr:PREDICTED: solute carrier organic anion transporter family member 2A1-like isoform X1 [Papilio xuthus]